MIKRMRVQPAAHHGFFRSIKKYAAGAVLATSLIFAAPHTASAIPNKIDDDAHYDGRVQNFDPDVELPSSSNGMTWFLVLAMGFVCVSVIFKDAKRSHLD